MGKSTFTKEVIEEILHTQDYKLLEGFKDSKAWKSMTEEEKKTLALLFLLAGEEALEEGDLEPQAFVVARKICPDDPYIPFRQALAYREIDKLPNYDKVLGCLLETIELDPFSYDPWFLWGKTLLELGIATKDCDIFFMADEKFERASELISSDEMEKDFYWHWGSTWHYIAKYSGEAPDYQKAIGLYRKAEKQGQDRVSFWNDFGNALVDFCCLVSQDELLFEAIKCYHQVVKQAPHSFEGWINLACSYKRLHELTCLEKYFIFANECFERASTLDGDHEALHFKWGVLLVAEGKRSLDPKILLSSLEHFQRLPFDHPFGAHIYAKWAEAEVALGVTMDRVDYLLSAEKRLKKCLDKEASSEYVWLVYGICHNELGKYFLDDRYYKKAIDAFQHGLSIDRKDFFLWYGLAISHYVLGTRNDDDELIEKTILYCERAIELNGEVSSQFWNDWGAAYLKLGQLRDDLNAVKNAIEKFAIAIELYQKDNELETINPEWLYNFGCAYDFLGDYSLDPEHFEQSIVLLKQAVIIDPEFTAARHNLGLAYTHLGELVGELDLFSLACAEYQKVIAIDQEDDLVWADWAYTLISSAELINDPAHELQVNKLYREAEGKIKQAIALGNEYAYYLLASLYALMGKEVELVVQLLVKVNDAGMLPPSSVLDIDNWLDPVRDHPHFQEFLQSLEKEI